MEIVNKYTIVYCDDCYFNIYTNALHHISHHI